MAAFANYLFSSSPRLPCSVDRRVFTPVSIKTSNGRKGSVDSRRMKLLMRASDSSVSGFSAGDENPRSKDRAFYDLIRDIEPLDVSLIQKDVPLTTVDAMKRTISGMLGLLPSEQFQVTVEALWKPIFKLLVSSLMTGYTLRNAEYRLSLEQNLEIFRVNNNGQNNDGTQSVSDGQNLQDMERGGFYQESFSTKIPDFDKMTPDVQQYISDMHSRLSSLKKELHDVKRKSAALQMQQFVGEEKNDLLDYLRSLEPEKVAELSEPTSLELKETIDSVVHGLLATLSPKMQSKGSEPREGSSIGTMKMESEGDHIDLVEDTSLHFEPLISLPRDYLARLLFWCMLLGHYLRGLEYRVELTELLSVPCSQENDAAMTEQDA